MRTDVHVFRRFGAMASQVQHAPPVRFLRSSAGWACPLALTIVALFYYAQYYRSGLNLGGEGGTIGVLAMRLMEGQRPIADTFIGYNVLWFYPVVWLFSAFGPNYIALRIFFFAICTATALVGYFSVEAVTRRRLLAFATGLILVLIPGMLFRNYMGLLGVLNGFALLHAFVLPSANGWRRAGWMLLAGAVLGVTYLVRVDIGVFLTPVWAGLCGLLLLRCGWTLRAKLGSAVGALLLGALAFAIVHAPVYADAEQRGFGENFRGQYTQIFSYLGYELRRKIAPPEVTPPPVAADSPAPGPEKSPAPSVSSAVETIPAPEPGVKPTPGAETSSGSTGKSDTDVGDGSGTRLRPGWSDLRGATSFYDAVFPVIIHLPVLMSVLMLGVGGGGYLLSLFRRDAVLQWKSLAIGTTLGVSLAFFPQYFFFRPDTPHLSEFMVPFLLALACTGGIAWDFFRSARSRWLGVLALMLVVLCVASAGLYVYHSFPKESAGTIAAARKRHTEFRGDNGVHVLLRAADAHEMQLLYEAIVSNSGPDDWVVSYPYSPTINFLTNRRSYEFNLYVDNATASRRFHAETVAEMEKHRPAVVVIDNRAINQRPDSRFAVWAQPTYDYVRANYRYVGTFRKNEVYVRPGTH